MTTPSLTKGWCPGALRPMPAGDGLLVRIKPAAGGLPVAIAVAIARLAAAHGNGRIDLTRRGNLQLRGVREGSLPGLTDELAAYGLIDPGLEAEAVRNVMVSPLAGLDPNCTDGRQLARSLEARLRDDVRLHALPAKFAFVIDGGGAWPLSQVGADIRLVADGAAWRMRLDGTNAASRPLASDAMFGHLVALAITFAASGHKRMRDWLEAAGPDKIFAAAELASDEDVPASGGVLGSASPGPLTFDQANIVVAVGIPFGSMQAEQLERLAQACSPGTILRLTPWRIIALPTADHASAAHLLRQAAEFGLLTAPNDPRSRIEACTGAPGCANASTQTRRDAERLIAQLAARESASQGPYLHVSGCAKSCAHSGTARVTLVAHNGRYDVIRNGAVSGHSAQTGIAPDDLSTAIAQLLEPA